MRIWDLPVLDPAERRGLLEEWNGGAACGAGGGVHELFAEQAARTPEAVAVVSGRALTYAELDVRVERLAGRLAGWGGAGVGVGVLLERSLDLVVALLGVLQAGGAYLPLDPGYPAARLRFCSRTRGCRWW